MLGWFRRAAARASRSTHRRASASSLLPRAESVLTATLRPSRVSSARKTSPLAPLPSASMILYGPMDEGTIDIPCRSEELEEDSTERRDVEGRSERPMDRREREAT